MFHYLLVARAVYALAWFYLSPLLPLMARDLSVQEAQLGWLPAAFIAGAAAMQIPASWIGARIGDVRTAGIGLFLLGLGSALVGASGSWPEALAFRALAGAGAGLFFSTAGAALVSLRPEAAGAALGWYNAAFNVGALAGYYWGYVAALAGWRAAAVAPGLAIAAIAVPLIAESGFRHEHKLDASAVTLGLASFPIWGAVYAANSLAASWLTYYRHVPPSLAGAISSASMASGLLGGALGAIYDRARNKGLVFAATSILTAAAMASMPYLPPVAAPAAVFAYGVFYTIYITAIYAEGSRRGQPSSALAVINVIDMALGLNISYLFSYAMAIYPPLAWAITAVLASASASAAALVLRRS